MSSIDYAVIQKATAPGKVILFGEHAVVYGFPAIAVPIDGLSAQAVVEATRKPGLQIISWGTDENIILRSNDEQPRSPLALAAMLVLEHLGKAAPNAILTVQSNIPIASGLGSGAAVATAIIRALSIFLDQHLEITILNRLVFEVEKTLHGNPSGIDNTVIVYEKPVYFVRNYPIEQIKIQTPLHLLIADSGRTAPTHEMVAAVSELYENHPVEIEDILAQIGKIARQAKQALQQNDPGTIGTLMCENHEQLRNLGVSSVELDRLVAAALDAGALGAKLSGGGRGGNMIALVQEETIETVSKGLKEAGAVRIFSTVIG